MVVKATIYGASLSSGDNLAPFHVRFRRSLRCTSSDVCHFIFGFPIGWFTILQLHFILFPLISSIVLLLPVFILLILHNLM